MSAANRVTTRTEIRAATYSQGELAQRLGRSPDWLYERSNKDRLYTCGMPRPLPGPGQARWNRAQIEAWLAGWIAPIAQAANDRAAAAVPPADDRNLKDWQEHLAGRYRRA